MVLWQHLIGRDGNFAYTPSPDFFGKVKGEQGAQVETMEVRRSLNLQWCHIVGSTFTVPILIPQQKYIFLIVLVTNNNTDIEWHQSTDIFHIPVPSLQS